MKKLSLFSGIGGLDLGAKMAGMETIGFCEIEKYPVEVLKKRFPNVPIYNDVKELSGYEFRGSAQIISGGFPCQPFSIAGGRKGDTDERHLFPHMARIISEARPEWVVAENVAGLLSIRDERGIKGGVLGDCLSRFYKMGYSVGLPFYGAYHIGAPHQRNRIFLVANKDPRKIEKLMNQVRASLTPWQGDLWPTPTVAGNYNRKGLSKTSGDGLVTSVKKWNTPTVQMSRDCNLPPFCETRDSLPGDLLRLQKLWSTLQATQRGGTRADFSRPLNTQVAEAEGRSDLIRISGNQILCKAKLNPEWCELLMGFPVGWTSLEECEDNFRGFPAGQGFYQYKYEPQRLVDGCKDLAKRLKGLGNGVVPEQGHLIFKAIKMIELGRAAV